MLSMLYRWLTLLYIDVWMLHKLNNIIISRISTRCNIMIYINDKVRKGNKNIFFVHNSTCVELYFSVPIFTTRNYAM